MSTKAAKELLHIRTWLQRVEEIVARGCASYIGDALLQGRRLARGGLIVAGHRLTRFSIPLGVS